VKTSSAKQKGRKLQQWTRDTLLSLSEGLEPDDIKSTSMGASGEDVQLSPAARRQWPFSIECKSRKAFAFYKDYEQAVANCPKGSEPILVCKGDRKKPMVILDAEWFFKEYKK